MTSSPPAISPLEMLSPLDPFSVAPTRSSSHEPFVLRGRPREHRDVDLLYSDPTAPVGSTKPLRVVKKAAQRDRIAGLGPASRHRRVELSAPSSPISSRRGSLSARSIHSLHSVRSASPISTRFQPMPPLPPSAALSEAHQLIAHMFLATDPMPPSIVPPRRRSRKRAASLQSDFHLGLGRFETGDGLLMPGPSPPVSAGPSPMKAAFGNIHDCVAQSVASDRPPLPMTPGRAPRKAAELLGASKSTSSAPRPKRKVEHYRPLPSHVKVELDRLLGNVQQKRTKSVPSGVKTTANAKAQSRSHDGGGSKMGHNRAADNVGEGETVAHRGEDGTMWLDVEGEQEFAWLMAEVLSLLPVPLPRVHKAAGDGGVVWEETSDAEDLWGMKAFTSVLELPKIRAAQAKAKAGGKKTRHMDDSFFDMETPRPSRALSAKLDWDSKDSYPWSSPRPVCGLQRHSTEPIAIGLSASVPVARSISPAVSLAASSRSTSSLSSSSQKASKRRPPPLALKAAVPCRKLPIAVSASHDLTAPYPFVAPQMVRSNSDQPRSSSLQPTTPFVHPRTAPKAPHVPHMRPLRSNAPAGLVSVTRLHRGDQEERSFFEPPTPTVRRQQSSSGKHPLGVAKDAPKESKGGWLRRMGKAVTSGTIV